MKSRLFLVLIAFLLAQLCVSAKPFANVPTYTDRIPGDVETVAGWNSTIPGIATYVNNSIVAILNVVTVKADLYVYDGNSLAKQAVGTNADVLVADNSRANGIKWGTGSVTTATKGDLIAAAAGGGINQVAVGANNYTLTADDTAILGVSWQPQNTEFFPTGTILSWSPAAAGTSTIPTGWVLCNGGNGSPNLIGRFVIGSRPNGDGSTPSAGGHGAQTVDANGAGTLTAPHTHTQQGTFATSGYSGSGTRSSGGGTFATQSHTHNLVISGQTGSTAPSRESADYVLVYIMKT